MGKIDKNRKELLKEKCLRYLGGKKCYICKVETLPPQAYHFHHYKGAKKYNLSEMIQKNMPWKEIAEELDKCRILCSNCHTSVTYNYIDKKSLF